MTFLPLLYKCPCIVCVCACTQCLHNVFRVCGLWYCWGNTWHWPTEEVACVGGAGGGVKRVQYHCNTCWKVVYKCHTRVCVCAYVRVCACVRACVRVCVCADRQYYVRQVDLAPHSLTHQCRTICEKRSFLTWESPTCHSRAS